MANGCPIGNTGRFIHVEMFYNPDNIRRFGSLAFGSEVFGDAGGSGAGRWVDITNQVGDLAVRRGQQRPNAFTPVDQFTFNVVDPDGTFFVWTLPPSLASPTIGVPCRVGWSIDQINVDWIVTGLVDSINELADVPERTLVVACAGTKSLLSTPLFFPDRPRETARERIEAVIDQIGYPYPVQWDPILSTVDLEADDGGTFRDGVDAFASTVIEEAANSAGLQTYNLNDGTLAFASVGARPFAEPGFTVSNCFADWSDAVANTITYRADAFEVLNVVQVINRLDPARSAEASDPTSIALYGRRADGYGFPLTTVNQTGTEAQVIANQILAETKDLVNRVEDITLSTLTDPRWWDLFPTFDMFDAFYVERREPVSDLFVAQLIGYDLTVSQVGVNMILNCATIDTSDVRTIDTGAERTIDTGTFRTVQT